MCTVSSFARSQASERASRGGPGRARISSSLYVLFSFPELSRATRCSSFCQDSTTTSSSTSSLSSWSDTSDYRADDGRESDDETGTGRLTPVVASPAIFPRASDAYLLGDLRRSGLSNLSTTILAVIKRTPHFVILLSDDNGSYIHNAAIAVCFLRIYAEYKYKCVFSTYFIIFDRLCRKELDVLPGAESIRKIFDSTLFKQRFSLP